MSILKIFKLDDEADTFCRLIYINEEFMGHEPNKWQTKIWELGVEEGDEGLTLTEIQKKYLDRILPEGEVAFQFDNCCLKTTREKLAKMMDSGSFIELNSSNWFRIPREAPTHFFNTIDIYRDFSKVEVLNEFFRVCEIYNFIGLKFGRLINLFYENLHVFEKTILKQTDPVLRQKFYGIDLVYRIETDIRFRVMYLYGMSEQQVEKLCQSNGARIPWNSACRVVYAYKQDFVEFCLIYNVNYVASISQSSFNLKKLNKIINLSRDYDKDGGYLNELLEYNKRYFSPGKHSDCIDLTGLMETEKYEILNSLTLPAFYFSFRKDVKLSDEVFEKCCTIFLKKRNYVHLLRKMAQISRDDYKRIQFIARILDGDKDSISVSSLLSDRYADW